MEEPRRREIHTTDRQLFRQCRRAWNWKSPLRGNLTPAEDTISALWFGTGIHFAMEDWHGLRKYKHPLFAFEAYVKAQKHSELPEDYKDLQILADDMLDYYASLWEPKHLSNYKTIWRDGYPLVEVRFSIPLPELGDDVYYVGHLDRLVEDEEGRIWVVDYKTCKQFDTAKLDTDPQVSAYTWAATYILGKQPEGVLWVQLLKSPPQEPRVLVNGEISQAKNQRTTWRLYRKTLLKQFGDIPQRYIPFLNWLAEQETEHGDKYIRYDRIRRNAIWIANEEWKILAEGKDMLDPALPLYPNFTRDCVWMCSMRSACLAMDDGSDYDYMLRENFKQRQEKELWRQRLNYPTVPITL